jgi:hypothetical protein
LTSQIFANIYLNELDRFVKHNLKLKYYLRYGDDFIILAGNKEVLEEIRQKVKRFLSADLRLEINDCNDIIIKTTQGLKFLGAMIYPWGRQLSKRNIRRLRNNLTLDNLPSYRGLTGQYEAEKSREIDWLAVELLNNIEQ